MGYAAAVATRGIHPQKTLQLYCVCSLTFFSPSSGRRVGTHCYYTQRVVRHNAPLSPTSGMARSDGETHGDESREQYFDPSLEAVEDHAFDDLMEASAQGGLSESERTSSTPSSLCCFCRYWIMRYVQRGQLSDKPGCVYYVQVGEFCTGLPKLRCLRGNGSGEGYHTHGKVVAASAGEKAVGPAHHDNKFCDFNFRWNFHRGQEAGLRGYNRGLLHTDIAMEDELYDVILNVGGEDFVKTSMPGHVRLDMSQQPLMRSGCYYMLHALKMQREGTIITGQTPLPAPPRKSQWDATAGRYIADQLGIDKEFRVNVQAEDVAAFVAARGNKERIAAIALERNLLIIVYTVEGIPHAC